MDRILFFSHGDKGGVGKSMTSTFAVEFSLKSGGLMLVETDPKQPDVGKRYREDPDVTLAALSLNQAGDAANALARFGDRLEKERAERVVVNLPSGAGETIDEFAGAIRELADGLGYRLIVTYGLDKGPVPTEAMVESLRSGLLSVVDIENRWVVYPLCKGGLEIFNWYKDERRKEGLIGEISFPVLKNAGAFSKLDNTEGRIAGLIEGERPEGWGLFDQMSVREFYKQAIVAISPIFERGN